MALNLGDAEAADQKPRRLLFVRLSKNLDRVIIDSFDLTLPTAKRSKHGKEFLSPATR